MTGLFAATLGALLTACSNSGNDPAATGISEGEARALDEAAEMLDEKRLPEGAIPPLNEAQEPAGESSEAPSE